MYPTVVKRQIIYGFYFIFHSFKFRFKSFSFFYFVDNYYNNHQKKGSTKTRKNSNMRRRNRHGGRWFLGFGRRYLFCHYCIFHIVETGEAWETFAIICVGAAWLIKIKCFLDFKACSIYPFCFILLCMILCRWLWIKIILL